MTPGTVAGHLTRLYADGEEIDLWRIVPESTYRTVSALIAEHADRVETESGGDIKALQPYLEQNFGIAPDIYSKVRSLMRVLQPQS